MPTFKKYNINYVKANDWIIVDFMKTILWLDDIRDPYTGKFSVEVLYLKEEYLGIKLDTEKCKVYWVKTQKEFENYIKENGLPDLISFDNDLGIGNGEGYDCAKWLVEYCIDNNIELPQWYVHSSNPVAKENINTLFENFEKNFKMEKKITALATKDIKCLCDECQCNECYDCGECTGYSE